MEGGGGDPADGSAAASSAAEPRNVNEEIIRRHCEQYSDEMKGQAGRDLLFDFKDMHNKLLHFGTHSKTKTSEPLRQQAGCPIMNRLKHKSGSSLRHTLFWSSMILMMVLIISQWQKCSRWSTGEVTTRLWLYGRWYTVTRSRLRISTTCRLHSRDCHLSMSMVEGSLGSIRAKCS